MRHAQVLISLGLALLGPSAIAAQSAADTLRVIEPYVRVVLPGQSNSASFMVLENSSDRTHALRGASTPLAGVVELHTHIMQDGMMRMRPVDEVALPPGATVRFEPGGLHLMWIGLIQPLEAGQEVPLTLLFEDGSRRELRIPVRDLEMPGMPHQHHGM